jgi:ribosomal protein L37AE/L43A
MYKVMFATLLAAGLLAAPLQQNSSAAFAQQSKASEKTAKTKTEPSAGQLAARERQKKCADEWKETKAARETEKAATCRNSGATATGGSRPPQNNAAKFFQRAVATTTKA